jgi:hypothetical protein
MRSLSMSSRRNHFSWSFAVLLSLAATMALAEPTSSSSTMLQGGEQSTIEDAHTLSICHASLCETDQDCQSACPSATSATCVSNVCEYTYNGGGGGGGGGPLCNEQLCFEDGDCTCGTKRGYCGSNFVCYF